jgi:hypothetical protein
MAINVSSYWEFSIFPSWPARIRCDSRRGDDTEVGMAYIVRWLKDGMPVAEERFDSLQDAKNSALAMLPFYRDQAGASRAVVCDERGTIYLNLY